MSVIVSCFKHKNCVNDLQINYSGNMPPGVCNFANALNVQSWTSHIQPFACVIYSKLHSVILLVRDHLGIEPLYYHHSKQKLIVAQSIGDILQHLAKRPSYNHRVLRKMRTSWMDYTDETHYQGIYRVEPGHMMLFQSDGTVVKKAYWSLKKQGSTLYYKDDRDYVAHFAGLLDEALLSAVGQNAVHCASEFSAGLDSSAIYCAAHHLGIYPTLFMNQPSPGTKYADTYNNTYEDAFLRHYRITKLQRIGAESFNPIEIFREYANWFAGPAPYLFFMFSQPLHSAVAKGEYPILLSGFGGDQCVSGLPPKNFYVPQLIRESQFQRAWHEIFDMQNSKTRLEWTKSLLNFVMMTHPSLYATSIFCKKQLWRLGLRSNSVHPYYYRYYKTLREAECSLVQGVDSYEVRMRIEYSSIVAKKMGFSYRYPLLYPKLLEFMLSLPVEQKRRDGKGRYLIRRYLEYKLGYPLFNDYRKTEGLAIIPNTLHLFKQTYDNGGYRDYFPNLSRSWNIRSKNTSLLINQKIQELMLQFATDIS